MGNATIRSSAYDFLFDFNRNYVSIFYRFRDRFTFSGFLVELRLVTDRRTDTDADTGPWLVPRMHSIAR